MTLSQLDVVWNSMKEHDKAHTWELLIVVRTSYHDTGSVGGAVDGAGISFSLFQSFRPAGNSVSSSNEPGNRNKNERETLV